MTSKVELQAKCRYIIFRNESNHYTVARFQQSDAKGEQFIATGCMAHLESDVSYRLSGEYVQHPRYGIQFQVSECSRIMPDDREALIRFFSGSHFHGIGPAMAAKLVDTLGKDLSAKIREDASCLDLVEGMNERKKQAVLDGLRASGAFDESYAFLLANGLSTRQISVLEEHYGDAFADVLEEDPYRPFFEIEGFGFRSCERLAEHYHIDPADARRQRALVYDTLIQYCFRSGSTFLRMEHLQAQIMQRYGFAPDEALQTLIEKGVLVEEEGRLYDHRQHAAECVIAARLNHPEPPAAEPEDLDEAIKHVEETLNITYDESQKAAIRGFFNHSFMILNGGPGTGKTTVIHGILLLDQKLYPDDEVTLAAPTGRAAKRLSELSGREASTLHSLLKWDLETNTFLKDEKDPLSSDVVIVDEFSMVDSLLFAALLKALRPQTKLLLIGDQDQLPSVSSGKVLQDLIESGRFPLYCLDTIYRQSQGSGIATLAAAMRNGSPLTFEQDVRFIECSAQQVRQAVIQVVENALAAGYAAKDVQVLSPRYQGPGGIDVLNQALQEIINPPDAFKHELKVGYRLFREGDKVLQLRNMREDAVYNGDIGEIIEIVPPQEAVGGNAQIIVSFDDQIVEYEQDALSYLTHAYCMSVHKSQGNEYPVVVMVVLPQHRFMLDRRLLYTGITRARRALILLGDPALFSAALAQEEREVRDTTLQQRLARQYVPLMMENDE